MSRRRDKVVTLSLDRGPESSPNGRRRRGPTLDPSHEQADGAELIAEAATLFSRRYGREVSAGEARLMLNRLSTFFGLLIELEGRNRPAERAA